MLLHNLTQDCPPHAGSTGNGGVSAVSESVAESSPLGWPTASTIGGFSERIKHKTSDSTMGTVSAEGGVPGGKPGRSPRANNQGISALAVSDSKPSVASPADGILLHTLRGTYFLLTVDVRGIFELMAFLCNPWSRSRLTVGTPLMQGRSHRKRGLQKPKGEQSRKLSGQQNRLVKKLVRRYCNLLVKHINIDITLINVS